MGHLEVLTEEPSMEAFLKVLLPRMLPARSTFNIHVFRGKHDLLRKLPSRLRGYAAWMPESYRVVVVVDRDNDDCCSLKAELEAAAAKSGLISRSQAGAGAWQVVNRIAIEELEAWYFGDWEAVRNAYPRVLRNIPNRTSYRNPDVIRGGTWETFERIMRRHGYFKEGLRKVQAAGAIAECIDPARSRSRSFKTFCDAVVEATA